jgi:hypothetical protein
MLLLIFNKDSKELNSVDNTSKLMAISAADWNATVEASYLKGRYQEISIMSSKGFKNQALSYSSHASTCNNDEMISVHIFLNFCCRNKWVGW